MKKRAWWFLVFSSSLAFSVPGCFRTIAASFGATFY